MYSIAVRYLAPEEELVNLDPVELLSLSNVLHGSLRRLAYAMASSPERKQLLEPLYDDALATSARISLTLASRLSTISKSDALLMNWPGRYDWKREDIPGQR